MATEKNNQMDLFGRSSVRCEYYPVLLPDEEGLNQIAILNEVLVQHGVKPSQLTKLPHVSIDGLITLEDDEKVVQTITTFLATRPPLHLEFSEFGFYPGRGGITLKVGIHNDAEVKDFNKQFMDAIGGKVTKLDLHLTLARYVNLEIYDRVKGLALGMNPCTCRSVAVYKKEYKAKGAYEVIERVNFGDLA